MVDFKAMQSEVVKRLREAPFNMQMSLIDLHGMKPAELRALVHEVMGHISDAMKASAEDLTTETAEVTAQRIAAFANVLKYKMPEGKTWRDFRAAMVIGEMDTVLPFLAWALADMETHVKRAYLTQFLSPLNVPAEFLNGPDGEELKATLEEIQELQEQFKVEHKQIDAFKEQMKANSIEPGRLKVANQKLLDEKEQLEAKIKVVKAKVEGVAGFDDLLSLVSRVRTQKEELAQLEYKYKEQSEAAKEAEEKVLVLSGRLREMRLQAADGSASAMLQQMKDELEYNERRLNEELPKELEGLRARKAAIDRALSDPNISNEGDLVKLQDEFQSLSVRLREKVEERNRFLSRQEDSSYRQQMQMAKMVREKKAKAQEMLDRVNHRKLLLQKEIDEKTLIAEAEGSRGALGGDDWKQFTEGFHERERQKEEMSLVLDRLSVERAVLGRTEAILTQKMNDIGAHLQEREAAAGVSGFLETQGRLEAVSQVKSEADEAKALTLEEMSKIVTEINDTIKEKKVELQPRIKDLRALRAEYQEVEGSYTAAKKAYDQVALVHQAEREKLEQQIAEARKKTAEEESNYFALQMMTKVVDERIKVVLGPKAGEYQKRLERRLTEQTQEQVMYNNQANDLAETEVSDRLNKHMFEQLHEMLEVRIASLDS